MRDIYLVDFENVASEGLSGITYLAPEDQVIIFYSNNSNRLSMKMHILIGKSVCKLDYFEATVGGKNALDHQISTWLGYLVGTNAAERSYYIVSRDMGYKFVASFWADSELKPNVRCIENIRVAGRLERSRAAKEARAAEHPKEQEEAAQPATVPVELEPVLELQAAPETAETVPAEQPEIALTPEPPTETAHPEAEEQPQSPQTEEQEPVQQSGGHGKGYRGRQFYRRNWTKTGRASAEKTGKAEPAAEQSSVAEPAAAPEIKQEAAAQNDRSAQPEQPVKTEQPVKAEPRRDHGPRAEVRPEPKRHEPSEPQAQKTETEPKPDGPKSDGPKSDGPKPARRNARTRQRAETEPKKQVELGQLLSPYPNLQEQQLQQLIAENKRQVLCNTLRKQLGQEKGLALYNEIKKSAWR